MNLSLHVDESDDSLSSTESTKSMNKLSLNSGSSPISHQWTFNSSPFYFEGDDDLLRRSEFKPINDESDDEFGAAAAGASLSRSITPPPSNGLITKKGIKINKEIISELTNLPDFTIFNQETTVSVKKKNQFTSDDLGIPIECLFKFFKFNIDDGIDRIIKLFIFKKKDQVFVMEKILTEIYFQKKARSLALTKCKDSSSTYKFNVPEIISYGYIEQHSFTDIDIDSFPGTNIAQTYYNVYPDKSNEAQVDDEENPDAIVFYIEMELVSGTPFIITKSKCRSDIQQLTNINQCLTRNGLFHNDYNTGNILIDDKENILHLIDYGEATDRRIIDGDITDFVSKDLIHINEFEKQCKALELLGKKHRISKKRSTIRKKRVSKPVRFSKRLKLLKPSRKQNQKSKKKTH